MSHANAHLTPLGRRLIVDRVAAGTPKAHVAAAMGISRRTVAKWCARFAAHGTAGLLDRSSRPHHSPTRTSAEREAAVLDARTRLRSGPARISQVTGVPARTVTRILARHQVPTLARCDPMTGLVIRAERATHHRYERSRPGELVHVDVKKLGRIPDGGGWRAHGRSEEVRGRGIGYDYVHAAVDDHSRFAYAEVLPNEQGQTCAGFLLRAAAAFAAAGIPRIERVITDNAKAYRISHAFSAAATQIGATQKFIQPHCPWQNGKVERFNRTMATEWAYAQIFTSSTARTQALAPWLEHYNTARIHQGTGHTPTDRLATT